MNKAVIKKGIKALAAVDGDVAAAVDRIGLPEPRLRPAGFETLFATIVSQQISTEAARAIRDRVLALMPELSPQALLALDPEALRAAGLSYRKVEYAQGLAEAIDCGRFNVDGLEDETDDAVIEAITALRGFGRWSAEIYLMFSLQRRDVFPADDLALRAALARLKNESGKLTPKTAREMVSHWAPWRSVGSLFLWHYYRGAPD